MTAAYPRDSSKKTETVSYRIRSDVKSALIEEARRLGINPNALVAQVFNRHISWGRYVGQLKCIPVSKEFLRLMFGSTSRTGVEKVGRSLGESAAHEELLFLFSKITPGTILLFMDLWASNFDAWDHRFEDGKDYFTVKHDINLNFSYFMKAYVSAVLRSTLGTSVQFEAMSPSSVTFIFESPLDKRGDYRPLDDTGRSRGSKGLTGDNRGAESLRKRPQEA